MLATIAPAVAPVAAFKLDVTKVATIADFAPYGKVGKLNRYYVRNFTLVATIAV